MAMNLEQPAKEVPKQASKSPLNRSSVMDSSNLLRRSVLNFQSNEPVKNRFFRMHIRSSSAIDKQSYENIKKVFSKPLLTSQQRLQNEEMKKRMKLGQNLNMEWHEAMDGQEHEEREEELSDSEFQRLFMEQRSFRMHQTGLTSKQIHSFKAQRKKLLMKELSNLNPSHLKLIRDKVFNQESFSETYNDSFINKYVKDLDFNSSAKQKRYKRFANEHQSAQYRNAMIVNQMAPVIEQNKDLIKKIMQNSKRNIRTAFSEVSSPKEILRPGMIESQVNRNEKEIQVVIDAFNDEIDLKKVENQIMTPFSSKSSVVGDLPISNPGVLRQPTCFNVQKKISIRYLDGSRQNESPQPSSNQFSLQKKNTSLLDSNSPLPSKVTSQLRKSEDPKDFLRDKDRKQQSMYIRIQKLNFKHQVPQNRRNSKVEESGPSSALMIKECPSQLSMTSTSQLIGSLDLKPNSFQAQQSLQKLLKEFEIWSKATEPVFSGSVRPEINMIDRRKAQKTQIVLNQVERELINELKDVQEKLEQKKIQKGLWDIYQSHGQVPDCREGGKMIAIGREVFLFGGFGRELFEDMRLLQCFHLNWKWQQVGQKKPNSSPSSRLSSSLFSRAAPNPRFGSVMARFKTRIFLFGGGGHYIPSIKIRQSYNDIRVFDTVERKWIKDFGGMKGNYVPTKRMHHAGDILGQIFCIYGGIVTEQKAVVDDISLFDVHQLSWITCYIRYQTPEKKIGPRAMHSLTTFFNYKDSTELHHNQWSLRLWVDPRLQKCPSTGMQQPEDRAQLKYGFFLFGGFSQIQDTALGDYWLLLPETEANEENADFGKEELQLKEDKLYMKAINLTRISKGRPPMARFGHAACTIGKGKYIAVYGGRNNSLYKKLGTIALNDLALFNLGSFEWETVAMFGKVPPSRWGHAMVAIDDKQLLVFGGVNNSQYVKTVAQVFEFGEEPVLHFQQKAKEVLATLQAKIKVLQGN